MKRLREFVRDRIDNVPADHTPRLVPAGLAAIAILILFLTAGFTFHFPFTGGEGGHFVKAAVNNAGAVNKRTPVRVNGVDVGRVDHVDEGADGKTAILVMRITNNDVSVRRDASARIAWRTLLGQEYVALDPGSPSAPPLGNRAISTAHTSTQVDWDDFNSMFGARTRLEERHLIAELQQTLTNPRGQGRTLHVLGPSLAAIGRGVAPLRGSEPGDLRRLVQTTSTTVAALDRDDASLQRLVAGGDRALGATDAHRAALGEALRLSPAALHSTTLTMARLRPTLDRLDPLVAALRPGARRLGPATRALMPALHETSAVLGHTKPLLTAAPAALRALGNASREGAPLIDALQPTVKRTSDELLPWLDRRDPAVNLKVYQGIGPFFSSLASAAGEFDASGHWLHFPNIEGLNSLMLLDCDPGIQLQDLQRCLTVNKVFKNVVGGKW